MYQELPHRPSPSRIDHIGAIRALPRTIYLYLGLLILSYALPPLILHSPSSRLRADHAQSEAVLSDQDFGRYLTAENATRLIDFDALTPANEKRKKAPSSGFSVLGGFATQSTAEAISAYSALSKSTHLPNMDRRVLILQHASGKPLNEAALIHPLADNLRMAHTSPVEIDAEINLWRALYGSKPNRTGTLSRFPLSVTETENRIKKMHLHFLENLALADLYHRVNAIDQEKQARERLQSEALRTEIATLTQGIGLFLAGLFGFALVIGFCIAAATKNWNAVGRVSPVPSRIPFGMLMDAFLFYLTFYRGLGIVVSLGVRAAGLQPNVHTLLGIQAALQIGSGIVAILYVAYGAKKSDTTIADIGMTTRTSALADIGYGALGYCATLPLMLLAGLAAHAIFRHSTTTEPNPVLPLMVGTSDVFSRTLIFTMASAAAPFIEETFFRGVLFTGLRTRYGWVASAAISGVCFAVVHPLQDWLPIFTLGFAFGTMREMRQSLIPGMTAHFLQNTLSFLYITSLFS